MTNSKNIIRELVSHATEYDRDGVSLNISTLVVEGVPRSLSSSQQCRRGVFVWIEKIHKELVNIGDREVRNCVELVYAKIRPKLQEEPSVSLRVAHTLAAVYFARQLCSFFPITSGEKDTILACCLLWNVVKYSQVACEIHQELLLAEAGSQLRELGELLTKVGHGSHQLDPLPCPAMIVLLSHNVISPQRSFTSRDYASFRNGA
jgi:hypothetical protein